MYSKKVLSHFKNPHNQGNIKNADLIGQAGNPICGDIMKLYIKLKKVKKGKTEVEIIQDIKFETLGCAAAIATSSILTDMIKGKTLEEAEKLTKGDIVDGLDGLPPVKLHCSVLSVEALHNALKDRKFEVIE
jgi:nitrogen fixation NifU-like protein